MLNLSVPEKTYFGKGLIFVWLIAVASAFAYGDQLILWFSIFVPVILWFGSDGYRPWEEIPERIRPFLVRYAGLDDGTSSKKEIPHARRAEKPEPKSVETLPKHSEEWQYRPPEIAPSKQAGEQIHLFNFEKTPHPASKAGPNRTFQKCKKAGASKEPARGEHLLTRMFHLLSPEIDSEQLNAQDRAMSDFLKMIDGAPITQQTYMTAPQEVCEYIEARLIEAAKYPDRMNAYVEVLRRLKNVPAALEAKGQIDAYLCEGLFFGVDVARHIRNGNYKALNLAFENLNYRKWRNGFKPEDYIKTGTDP